MRLLPIVKYVYKVINMILVKLLKIIVLFILKIGNILYVCTKKRFVNIWQKNFEQSALLKGENVLIVKNYLQNIL